MSVLPVVPERNTLHTKLSMCFSGLPPAEQKVAGYLLHHAADHPDLPIAELAARVQVSKAVVVRMCQFLGFSGYREFRLEWARESPWQAASERVAMPIMGTVYRELLNTEDLLSVQALDQAAAAILRAKNFFIYGSGGSSLLAQLAAAAFASLGRLPVTFNEAMWRSHPPIFADAQTTVLVISHRGVNPQIQKVVDGDRERGATIITLTSNPYSELAHAADILLITGCPAGSDIRSLELSAARVVQMACLHALELRVQNLLEKSPEAVAD